MKADSVFSGISTFGRLPYYPCLASDDVKYDIAFIGTLGSLPTFIPSPAIKVSPLHTTLTNHASFSTGAPFDTGTSYRPGARFGPSGIRQGSRRLNL